MIKYLSIQFKMIFNAGRSLGYISWDILLHIYFAIKVRRGRFNLF